MPGSENPVCLILSYNMYGFSMGSLNVYMNNSEGKNLVASKTGDQGKSWDTIRVDLTSTSSYQVNIHNFVPRVLSPGSYHQGLIAALRPAPTSRDKKTLGLS